MVNLWFIPVLLALSTGFQTSLQGIMGNHFLSGRHRDLRCWARDPNRSNDPKRMNKFNDPVKKAQAESERMRAQSEAEAEEEAYAAFLKDNNFDYEPDKSGNRTEEEVDSYFPKRGKRKRIMQTPVLILRLTPDTNSNSFPVGFPQNLFKKSSEEDDDEDEERPRTKNRSEHFEVITKPKTSFKDVGGCALIKEELMQCADILLNYSKYAAYNVRVPKGIILEGPPGNGKTLLAKGFAGETKTAFIPVSGSQFQEKYVGVGSTRVRELFALAKENIPCIIFIDEIDAIGRSRSSDGEASSSERDNTLNELLIGLDGFQTQQGIFLMGATNRMDLLDPALTRPGRIDKKIYIGTPDSKTRRAILEIHIRGKPYNTTSITIDDLVEMTNGYSGAQIENVLNEAMLRALRYNRVQIEFEDLDDIINRMMVGWQPYDHEFSQDLIRRIAIHEMGHAIVGYCSKHHAKVTKISINLSSPTSPGFTLFESAGQALMKREALFEHLMILLGGRIAEELIYGVSTTTGAYNDLQEVTKLTEKMVKVYGMGNKLIYPSGSQKYIEQIDAEIERLLDEAYQGAKAILEDNLEAMVRGAEELMNTKVIKEGRLHEMMENRD